MFYRKWGKIRWAKLSHFSRFSGVSWKFFCEYKHFSLIVLNNEHLWPRQCGNISMKTLMMLNLWIFSPANLSLSTIYPQKQVTLWYSSSHHMCSHYYINIMICSRNSSKTTLGHDNLCCMLAFEWEGLCVNYMPKHFSTLRFTLCVIRSVCILHVMFDCATDYNKW